MSRLLVFAIALVALSVGTVVGGWNHLFVPPSVAVHQAPQQTAAQSAPQIQTQPQQQELQQGQPQGQQPQTASQGPQQPLQSVQTRPVASDPLGEHYTACDVYYMTSCTNCMGAVNGLRQRATRMLHDPGDVERLFVDNNWYSLIDIAQVQGGRIPRRVPKFYYFRDNRLIGSLQGFDETNPAPSLARILSGPENAAAIAGAQFTQQGVGAYSQATGQFTQGTAYTQNSGYDQASRYTQSSAYSQPTQSVYATQQTLPVVSQQAWDQMTQSAPRMSWPDTGVRYPFNSQNGLNYEYQGLDGRSHTYLRTTDGRQFFDGALAGQVPQQQCYPSSGYTQAAY